MFVRWIFVLAMGFLVADCAAPVTQPQNSARPYPVAPERPVTDDYFGVKVVDPYRWMEEDSSELRKWLEGQDAHARSVLASIPGHASLAERARVLGGDSERVDGVSVAGGTQFLLRRAAGAQTRALRARDATGKERTLVSTEPSPGATSHDAIDFAIPSPNGRYVAYGVSSGGSEDSTLYIVETQSGTRLPDQIDRTRFAELTWLPSSEGFYYSRQPLVPADAGADASYKRIKTYLHRLQKDPADDPAVFGYGVASSPGIDEDLFPRIRVTPGSPFAIAVLDHGVNDPLTLYVKPLTDVADGARPWLKFISPEDGVVDFAVRGDEIFLLTHRDAPRLKVVRLTLRSPDAKAASLVVPGSEAVLQNIKVARDALYVIETVEGAASVRRVGLDGASLPAPPLPFPGAISGTFADPTLEGILLKIEGWAHSEEWLRFDTATSRWVDTNITPPSPVDYSNMEVTRLQAKSKDGTVVPISLLHRRGIPLDRSNPVVLYGYGSYGISYDPDFFAVRLALLEQGVVMAWAHVRGGGEFGEEWHRAGQKENKQNAVDDFIACANALVEQGYTTHARLAAFGSSAGGLLISVAITQHPETFRAAIVNVGTTNMLRSEVTGGGAGNAAEFGSTKTPDGFRYLYEMDGYQHVRPGVHYPATLFGVAANDPRVPAWQLTKMLARIQALASGTTPAILRVDFNDGHGVGSTRALEADRNADFYAFLLWQLGVPAFQPHPHS